MVYVFEGDGKGKTSAALGVALRMLLIKKKVLWVSWFKSIDWQNSEMLLVDCFKKRLKMYWMGKGFYIKRGRTEMLSFGKVKSAQTNKAKVYDTETVVTHKAAAEQALSLVKKTLEKPRKGGFHLIVMDEVIKAVNEGLLLESDVLEVVRKRGLVHLVLTGHVCPKLLREEADLVTKMKKVKHPYDKGMLAVKGLDY